MRLSQPIAGLIGLLAIGGGAAGCGTAQPTPRHVVPGPRASGFPIRREPTASVVRFGWLGSGQAPPTWSPVAVLGGGALPRPPGWQPIPGDPGSVSFAQRVAGGRIVGYLNATPRADDETLASWERFRIHHNAAEGDRDVRALTGVDRLRIGADRASCVIDDYRTVLTRYREIACVVVGPRVSTVLIGAATPGSWRAREPVLKRAIAGFLAS